MNEGKDHSPPYQHNPPFQQGLGKTNAPNSQSRLSHNPAYTNSSSDLAKSDSRGSKPPTGSFVPKQPSFIPTSPKHDSSASKTIPSFLENKHSHLKTSLFVEGYEQRDALSRSNGVPQYSKNSMGDKPSKRAPRMS